MKPTLLVLAAGMGSRYGGLKQMDGLGPNGETIIDYSIFDAVQAGFGKVVYIVREYFLEQFKEAVARKYSKVKCIDGSPLEFVFVTQELDKIPARFLPLNPERQKPWGTAHAMLMAADVIKEPFVVINGDDFYGRESFRIAADWCRAHEGSKNVYGIVGFELDHTLSESGGVSRGICHYDAMQRLTDVVEHLNIVKGADGVVTGDNSATGEHVVLRGSDLRGLPGAEQPGTQEGILHPLRRGLHDPRRRRALRRPLHPGPLVRRHLQGRPPRRGRKVRPARPRGCLSHPALSIIAWQKEKAPVTTASTRSSVTTSPAWQTCSSCWPCCCSAPCWARC